MVVLSILGAVSSSLICDLACAFDSSMNMISLKEILCVTDKWRYGYQNMFVPLTFPFWAACTVLVELCLYNIMGTGEFSGLALS